MNNSYEPIIVSKDKDGKIVLTQKELEELLKKAYSNGYNAKEIVYVPQQTAYPTYLPKEDWTKITWGTSSGDIK